MKEKKNLNIWTILSVIICVILLAAEGLAIFRIWKLNMIPMKYLAIILPVMAVITVLLIIFLFPRSGKYQKNKKHVAQIIACILSLVMACGCFFSYDILSKVHKTFDTITTKPTVTTQIGVYVLANTPAQTLEDAAGYTFGFTDSREGENARAALSGIQETLGSTVKVNNFDTIFSMIDALYANDVQAIILDTAYLSILEEAEGYSNFADKARLLYQYSISDPVDLNKTPDSTQPTDVTMPEPTAEPADDLYAPFVVYLSGSDTRSAVLAKSRSDVNILAVVNPKTKQILLVNTPRDYYIPNPAGKGALDKLTHCGNYGVDCSMKALSDLYGCPISYNAQINFTGFETLIDAIGGISIYSEKGDGVYLKAGENRMNGKRALEFARNRYSYAAGDHARGKHQMQVITAIVDKLTSGSAIANYSKILDSLQGMFVTSMPSETLSEYIKMQLSDMAHWDVFSYAVTGTGSSKVTYSMPGMHASVIIPDKGSVARGSELIDQVLNGNTLTAADVAEKPNK